MDNIVIGGRQTLTIIPQGPPGPPTNLQLSREPGRSNLRMNVLQWQLVGRMFMLGLSMGKF